MFRTSTKQKLFPRRSLCTPRELLQRRNLVFTSKHVIGISLPYHRLFTEETYVSTDRADVTVKIMEDCRNVQLA